MAGTTDWRVAFRRAAVWGTAVTMAAGDLIKIESESVGEGIPEEILDDNVGDPLTGGVYQGNVDLSGASLNEQIRYEGFERRLALFHNDDTVTEVEAGIAQLHTMLFQPNNDGRYGTLVYDKGIGDVDNNLWEYPGVKLSGLELNHNNGRAMANWSLIPDQCVRGSDAAAINNAASMTAATIPNAGLAALYNNLEVRIAERTGSEDNLDGADELNVTNAQINVQRNVSGVHGSGTRAGVIDEPDTDGMPEATIVLSISRYTAALDALIKESQAIQEGRVPKKYKMSLNWTGPLLPGTAASNRYFMQWDFGSLTIQSAPVNAGGPGQKVPVELTLRQETQQSIPDGSDWAWATIGSAGIRTLMQNGNATSGLTLGG